MSKQARSVVGKKEMADLILLADLQKVSSKTPKTTKEMSNREKLKFRRSKTSSKRNKL